jgi:beta-lactamase superfamily II metal-dependent hydrolase
MPFWDRKIELAFLSHPNNDHYNGYFDIVERFKVDKFITVDSPIFSKTYKNLLEVLSKKKIPVVFKYLGDEIGNIKFLWPPHGFNSSNDNDYSSVIMLMIGSDRSRPVTTILFTGDASPFILGRLSHSTINKVNILKIPHHGSKNGLTKKFLDLADPSIAVISVGKKNMYGHPHTQVLDMLKAKNINIKRTDVDGNVVFKLPN